MTSISFTDTAPPVFKWKKLQKWETKTVVVIMTINRVSAISVKRKLLSVLWVQLKPVYPTSWCRLVLIRERKQKLIIFIHTSKASSAIGSLCTHSLQAGKIEILFQIS